MKDTNAISRVTNDSSFCPPESSFLQPHRPSRQPSTSGSVQPPTSRPLSSADEAGPVPKKMRSTVRQPAKSKPTKQSAEEPLKKARARPALKFANFFSSSGRRSQPTTSSRTASTGLGKNDRIPSNSSIATRRSTRLLTGNGNKQPGKVGDLLPCIF
jgi:anaphase-promoting complex subunit 3